MPSNFFSKLVKNSQAPQTPTTTTTSRSSSDGFVSSPPSLTSSRPHSQPTSHPPSPQRPTGPYSDAISSSSNGSVKIGVIPPSPRPTESDLSVHAAYTSSIEQVHQASLQHRRVRSQERHILDRHEVSLAARPTGDITHIMDETELTPTPGRPTQAFDWASSSSPAPSYRQLSPASSTGNLRGFVDKHSTRLQTPGKSVKEKPSKCSMRGTTQPPPPLNLDNTIDVQPQAGRHEDPLVPAPHIIIESPTTIASQKTQSQEYFGVVSDGDTKSYRSATSSSSKHKNKSRRPSYPPKTKGVAFGASMSQTPLVPPLSPLPPPVPASKSSLSVNGTKPDATPTRNAVAPMRSSTRNISRTRSDFSNGDAYASSGDESGSSSDELDLNERDIPVTGFAVASNKRNADFHELFPNIPEGDYLIEDYGCALQREILIQGRLYISENHICFHANIFGWITDLSIPIYEITGLEKKMTAFVIPNAIQITTRQAKYTFASFLSRDTTYDVINNIWRLARPDDAFELSDSHNASTRDMASFTTTSVSEGSGKESAVAGADKTVLPGTPDKIYNLMFASGFMKDFMKVDQRLIDVQISDWAPVDETSKLLQRNMSYIKPLNNSVGPRQTKCEIHDETVHCDFDDSMVMVTSTRTPDVPSGGVFVVRTRTCLMWASSISTRVIVTTQVEWTGRSFIKGLIEKSAIEGQKVYHSDLDKAMRLYIQEHQAEFVPEGLDLAAVAPAEPITPLVEANGGPEAPLSAVEARKAREHDRNRRGMQWAYDTLEGAYCVAERSTKGALELVKEAWEQSSSTTILWFVIVLLVFVNMWTLMLVGNREEVGRRKEMKRAEEKERWLQGVVAGVWEELGAERARAGGGVSVPLASVPVGDVQAEVANVGKMLDAVEQRVRTIRESLAGLRKDMVRKAWYEALASALQKEDQAVMQFATLEAPNRPRVRSLIQRGFITSSTLPTLPLILATTDVRTPKVTQLATNNVVEAVYWTSSTQEQFRVLGRASIVPAPGYSGPYPAPKGVVYDALTKEGFDWEEKRVAVFDAMSGSMKATWCRPVPGTPLGEGGEDEMKKWPERLPTMGDARSEVEKRLLGVALGNFALLMVEPFEVDYVELGVVPNRRTRCERDEGSVEFKETLVVP
ncbi:hypothetical protein JVT61DRAFT_5042 [Boletus reticuloceps]|uniref:VASt domain-containing protein n=1 Tax=Boletus reticuloceps TaxID=495285 RepID=A0A8I3ACS3_9AGAM|nr:hypothetical protein JVT61DRAFT_5042 [Boletus reticuloceps]